MQKENKDAPDAVDAVDGVDGAAGTERASRLKPKHQRLILLLIALLAIIGAGLLGTWALRNQASYFYLPAEILSAPPAADRSVRLGGMVQAGSLKMLSDGVTVSFFVTDQKQAHVPVLYTGLLPDIFVENSGVVAEGRMRGDGVFMADSLLAKHDENYVPRELEELQGHDAKKALGDVTGDVTGDVAGDVASSVTGDGPAVDGPAVDGPAVDGPAVDGPADDAYAPAASYKDAGVDSAERGEE